MLFGFLLVFYFKSYTKTINTLCIDVKGSGTYNYHRILMG
jgi:hypothetical protein